MILYIKHIDIEGPETLGSFFDDRGFKPAVVNLHTGEKLPRDLKGVQAVISLGGPMNVYEEGKHPFLRDEDAFLKSALRENVPVLGICLGAQLLTKAAGGRVVRSPQQEIGWYSIQLTSTGCQDPLFEGLPSSFEVYQWHGDMCEPVNNEAVLASSARCPVQAVRLGPRAYGIQFHVEITDRCIEKWSADYLPEDVNQRQAMLSRYEELKPVFRAQGRRICENFLRVISQ